ncbi:MAG: hypothetical protein MZV64_31630 [Ignavibacteriales bacterium]|nr:hypothetical protein [Ignavibacteriales bacterium]
MRLASRPGDAKDAYPFPTRGVGFTMSYEFSLEGPGESGRIQLPAGDVREPYASWGKEPDVPPTSSRLGFADNTLPLAQQFRMGGRDSFLGLAGG